MTLPPIEPDVLGQLDRRGISAAEAARQLALFVRPPSPARLLRPCKVGDGILRLSPAEQARYESLGASSFGRGRWAKFVPASGAATRMFKDLLALKDGAAPSSETERVRAGLSRFAFASEFQNAPDPIAALVARYGDRPKGLIPFHQVDGRTRTAFEEHLREAAALVAASEGGIRAHFTVSPEHRGDFESLYAALKDALEQELHGRFRVDFSVQDPSTDTLAGSEGGRPFLDDSGRVVLRPGGHGALIKNLQDLARTSDRVLIKNIDNICHPRFWPELLRWKRILAGLLEETQEGVFGWLRQLKRDPAGEGEALAWARTRLGLPDLAADASLLLRRPIRICGVVPNTGEPGGGPFWVEGSRGPSRQIVESAQVDLKDPAQKAVFDASTHFNPVDLACGLGNEEGEPYDLSRFVDETASFVSKKSQGGRTLLALERPGLWNGAMAGWITLLVEVPLATFNPVKTLSDLLKREHSPASPGGA